MNKIKIILFMMLLLLSSTAFSAPSLFEIEVGKMSESEFKEVYKNAEEKGVSRYTGGTNYAVSPNDIDFGAVISDVIVVFDTDKTVSAVIAPLEVSGYDRIKSILNKKYNPTDDVYYDEGVGKMEKSAAFEKESVVMKLFKPVSLNAVYVIYATREFENAKEFDQTQRQKREKQHEEQQF